MNSALKLYDIANQLHALEHLGESDDLPRWETALVLDQTVRTDGNGLARIAIPAPSDGLASTYGVTASTNSTTASTRIATPLGERPVESLCVGDTVLTASGEKRTIRWLGH